MRKVLIIFVGMAMVLSVSQAQSTIDANAPLNLQKLSQQAIALTKNTGQWDERVKFRANAGGATIWFAADGVYYQFTRYNREAAVASNNPMDMLHDRLDDIPDSVEQLVIKASFIGANPDLEIVGEGLMHYKCNYFIGNDPSKWHTNAPNYKTILSEDVYPGIDLRYFANDSRLEYDIIVSPGADPNQITVQYDGAESVRVNEAGDLIVETSWGPITELKPLVFQYDAFGLWPIEGKYKLLADNKFGFELGTDDSSYFALVIDPVILYCTYLGGSGSEFSYSIAVDGTGCAYVGQQTSSLDFPVKGAYQDEYSGSNDVFITKFNPTGNSLVYSTYIGGSGNELTYGIAVDDNGMAYIAGSTWSTDFPTVDPCMSYQGSWDVFVAKLSASGSSLVFSTYIGGSDQDHGLDLVLDDSGSSYVVGWTRSVDFPTVNAYQTDQGMYDGFVMRLNSSGNCLDFSTYLGGSNIDQCLGVAVDASGSVYITGNTQSPDFPLLNHYQTDQYATDAFVTKFAPSGEELMYSTYLGGSDSESGNGICVDDSGAAYVTGSTFSTDFPTVNSLQTYQGNGDVFVSKLSALGSGLLHSTYLGGNYDEETYGIGVDPNGTVYVSGYTNSFDYPTLNPYQTDQPGADAIVTAIDSSFDSLIWSTYLGGNEEDFAYRLAVDTDGRTCVTGETYSTDFPTVNALQNYLSGSWDAFVAKISSSPPSCGDADGSGSIDIDDVVYLIAYTFTGGPPPVPLEVGNTDCADDIDIDDVVYLVAYIFTGGTPPCDTNGDGVPDC